MRMEKPVHILLPTDNLAGLYYSQVLPANASHQLSYAAVNHWAYDGFSVLEQYYDAHDAFICLAQVETATNVAITMACQMADIYWLYQLEGSYEIIDPASKLRLLYSSANHYTQVYAPQQRYICRFPAGHHLLFYFVIKPKWLHRQDGRAVEGFEHLLHSQQEQHKGILHNALMPMHGCVYEQLLTLFTLPRMKSLLQEIKIYEHCFNLLDLSQEDLHFSEERITNGSNTLAAIRHFIVQQTLQGGLPPIPAIADFFKINHNTLRKQHREVYGYSLQQYVHRKKMEQATHWLMSEDAPVSEIAYRLDYTDTQSFYKQFLKYYGVSPTTYRLKFKR